MGSNYDREDVMYKLHTVHHKKILLDVLIKDETHLVLMIFKEGAYLTLKKALHKALNLLQL